MLFWRGDPLVHFEDYLSACGNMLLATDACFRLGLTLAGEVKAMRPFLEKSEALKPDPFLHSGSPSDVLESIPEPGVPPEAIESAIRFTSDVHEFGGHEFVNGLLAIAVWSSLEVLVENLVTKMLLARPDLVNQDALSCYLQRARDKNPHLGGKEEAKSAIRRYESKLRTSDNLDAFEITLRLLGAAGIGPVNVDQDVKAAILELQDERNLVVHRHAEVDSRVACKAYWRDKGIKPGDVIMPTSWQIVTYMDAARAFVAAIKAAIREQKNESPVDGSSDGV